MYFSMKFQPVTVVHIFQRHTFGSTCQFIMLKKNIINLSINNKLYDLIQQLISFIYAFKLILK